MNMDNRVGTDCGSSGGVAWVGQGRARVENWDNCNRTTVKIIIIIVLFKRRQKRGTERHKPAGTNKNQMPRW